MHQLHLLLLLLLVVVVAAVVVVVVVVRDRSPSTSLRRLVASVGR